MFHAKMGPVCIYVCRKCSDFIGIGINRNGIIMFCKPNALNISESIIQSDYYRQIRTETDGSVRFA